MQLLPPVEVPPRERRSSALLFALVVFAAALGLRIAAADGTGPDRKPRPDALEYAEVGASLARGQGFVLRILDVDMPPRYPPGAPLALAPSTIVRGGRDAWIAAAVWSALAAALAAAVARMGGGFAGALAAAAIVATSPLSVVYGGLAMSEGPVQGLVAVVLLTSCAIAMGAGRSATLALVGGAAVAWLFLVRVPLVVFALPLAVAVLSRRKERGARVQRVALALAPLVLAAGALLLLQHRLFGDALRTGYHYWAPVEYVVGAEHVLSTRWLTRTWPLPFERPHGAAYARALSGLPGDHHGGVLWSLPAAVLAGVGALVAILAARRSHLARVMLAALAACAVLVAFHLVYFWQDPRFLAPLVVPVAACAGFGVATLARATGVPRVARAVAAALIVAACAGPVVDDFARIRAARGTPPSAAASLARLGEFVPRGALVIVDVPAPLARDAFPPGTQFVFTHLPSSEGHLEYVRKHELRNRRGEAPHAPVLANFAEPDPQGIATVEAALAAGREVFQTLTVGEGDEGAGVEFLRERGVRFLPVAESGVARLYRLSAP